MLRRIKTAPLPSPKASVIFDDTPKASKKQ